MSLGRWIIIYLKIILLQRGIWVLRKQTVVSDTMVQKQLRPLTTSQETIDK